MSNKQVYIRREAQGSLTAPVNQWSVVVHNITVAHTAEYQMHLCMKGINAQIQVCTQKPLKHRQIIYEVDVERGVASYTLHLEKDMSIWVNALLADQSSELTSLSFELTAEVKEPEPEVMTVGELRAVIAQLGGMMPVVLACDDKKGVDIIQAEMTMASKAEPPYTWDFSGSTHPVLVLKISEK